MCTQAGYRDKKNAFLLLESTIQWVNSHLHDTQIIHNITIYTCNASAFAASRDRSLLIADDNSLAEAVIPKKVAIVAISPSRGNETRKRL